MTYKTTTTSPAESFRLGEKIGQLLKTGGVVEFSSDLGGGKTVMIKGLALGLGYEGEVTSPTFTISRVYQLPDGRELHHFDFYRLGSDDIVVQELSEVTGDPAVVVAIEWAANAGDVLPDDRLRIHIMRQNESDRQITVEALGSKFKALVEALG